MTSRLLRALAAVALLAVTSVTTAASPAGASPARINGSGSSYVALAMQQWVAEGQTAGLQVNYLPTGSPQGLTSYGQSLVDFAGTEAEFSALQASGGETQRGFQYVPDVAGATAVLYNVADASGRKVDYLHLSPRTIALIFTGKVDHWNDPAISADNRGLVLPNQPITVVYRSGQSGTTGTFYDFVAHVAPDVFGPWAAKYQLPTGDVRIIQLDGVPNFAPKTQAFNGSDQIAQHISSSSGLWSIGYDEFGYAKTYGASAAWVQNKSGNWVLPYAENISAALESARLRPDLSQELAGVYTSPNPAAYPISAYSYLVTQCETAGDRPTCKGSYANDGVTETLAKWMRYIACEGQINMGRIGYSPLPPNLSQELVNSIARMQGSRPETLTAANCPNPRFTGSLGPAASSPDDPLAGVAAGALGDTAQAGGGDQTTATVAAGATPEAGAGGATTDEVAVAAAASEFRSLAPAAYEGSGVDGPAISPVVALAFVVAIPALFVGFRRLLTWMRSGLRRRRPTPAA